MNGHVRKMMNDCMAGDTCTKDRAKFGFGHFNWSLDHQGFPQALWEKNLPGMHETLVRFLGWEDPLEKG